MFSALVHSGFTQELKEVRYQDGEQSLVGLITENNTKSTLGVLILPAWMGIDQEAKTAALALQKEGYTAFIADIYGEGNEPQDSQSAAKLSSEFKTDFKAYQRRIERALEQMRASGLQRIAVIGYCFGGTGALEAARGLLPVEGVVCIHGGLSKAAERENQPIACKVLIEHPADDQSVKPEHLEGLIDELNFGKTDWQLVTYAHAKHTFTNPDSPDYLPVMAGRAWAHTLLFLGEVLKGADQAK